MDFNLGGAARPAREPKFLCIDVLRGLAALAVLLHHSNSFFWGTHGPYHPAWAFRLCHATFGHGDLGVELFFVISGFCIHLPNATAQRLKPRSFLVRRFFRIYPAYIVVVLLCFALAAAQSGLGLGSHAYAHHLLLNLAGHAVFWLYSFGAHGTVSPVVWTLALEAQFYVIYLLLFRVLRGVGLGRITLAWIFVDVAYGLAFSALHLNLAAGPLYTFDPKMFPLARFGEWLLGAWIAERVVAGQRGEPAAWQSAALIASAAALFGVAIAGLAAPILAPHVPPLVSVAFMLLIAGLTRREARRARSIGPPELGSLARWMSSRSYSMYLIHFTVIGAVGLVLARLLHIANRDGARGTGEWLLVTVFGIACALIATDLLYRLVEAPSHRLARRLSHRTPSPRVVPDLVIADVAEGLGA